MSEIHGAVGSYVVNALDPGDLDEFEAHLAVCPTCSREVVEFCETAAELSLMAMAVAPPPQLRTSVLSAIRDVRPLPPEIPGHSKVPPRRALLEVPPFTTELQAASPMSPASPVTVTRNATPIDELALRRSRRGMRALSALVAAAVVVALALGGWVWNLRQDQQVQVAEQAREGALYAAPDAKSYTTDVANGGQVTFVVSKQQNSALVIGTNLPASGSDKTYEMWTLMGTGATPDSLFTGGGQNKQWFRGPVATAEKLAITLEKAGGAVTPTLPIQAVVDLK